jgi:hypothetical protein
MSVPRLTQSSNPPTRRRKAPFLLAWIHELLRDRRERVDQIHEDPQLDNLEDIYSIYCAAFVQITL